MRGIYKITCLSNGKVYVGSTNSISRRWSNHKSNLKKGIHKNHYLQNAWFKYGKDAFLWEVLEEVEQDFMLVFREQYWLDETKCYEREFGFNTRKIAESNRGIKRRRNVINTGKKWIVTSPDGSSQEVVNLEDFCRKSELTVSALRSVAYCNRDHHKGWKCRFANMTEQQWLENRKRNRNRGYKTLTPYRKSNVTWLVTNPHGSSEVVIGLKSFCEKNSLNYRMMTRVSRGERNHYRGWLCERINL